MADPGFPIGGGVKPLGGVLMSDGDFSEKLYVKEECTPARTHLDPPMSTQTRITLCSDNSNHLRYPIWVFLIKIGRSFTSLELFVVREALCGKSSHFLVLDLRAGYIHLPLIVNTGRRKILEYSS